MRWKFSSVARSNWPGAAARLENTVMPSMWPTTMSVSPSRLRSPSAKACVLPSGKASAIGAAKVPATVWLRITTAALPIAPSVGRSSMTASAAGRR